MSKSKDETRCLSCDREILWLLSELGGWIAVDRTVSDEGRFLIDINRELIFSVDPSRLAEYRGILYQAHFDTCPAVPALFRNEL